MELCSYVLGILKLPNMVRKCPIIREMLKGDYNVVAVKKYKNPSQLCLKIYNPLRACCLFLLKEGFICNYILYSYLNRISFVIIYCIST